uniref:Mitochondrial import inner membrane translocase subunit Tim21 n=1 Tax=Corethrella appendiculata TaxID=1370023 RepID=U5EF33_9DIPT
MSLLTLRPLVAKQPNYLINLLRSRLSPKTLSTSQVLLRYYADKSHTQQSLSKSEERTDISTDVRPLGERVKENTKTASYMGVIVLGIGVTGIMFYAIFRELFSSNSPQNIYSEALDRCANDPRVQDSLGAPIKGFGEETRRRRRTHVAHSTYEKNGILYLRMQFYIQGIRNKGTVHLEMKQNNSGKFEYRYLFVQLDYYPHTTIILEDNRLQQDSHLSSQPSSLSSDLSSYGSLLK